MMKNKLTCFALLLVLFGFGCKKDASEDITSYNWVLKTQVVAPAITVNGKTTTDYLSLQNPSGCTKNFTFTFFKTGIFAVSSNGALCDMLANNDAQKWKLEGSEVILDYGNIGPSGSAIVKLNIDKNRLTRTSILTADGKDYSLTTTYIAQKK